MFHLLRDPLDCCIQTEIVEEGGAQIRRDPAHGGSHVFKPMVDLVERFGMSGACALGTGRRHVDLEQR